MYILSIRKFTLHCLGIQGTEIFLFTKGSAITLQYNNNNNNNYISASQTTQTLFGTRNKVKKLIKRPAGHIKWLNIKIRHIQLQKRIKIEFQSCLSI